jgi:hypothetical protein
MAGAWKRGDWVTAGMNPAFRPPVEGAGEAGLPRGTPTTPSDDGRRLEEGRLGDGRNESGL